MARKFKFQWYFDFATDPDTMQIFTVSAGGEICRRRLWPQFAAHKYYKLGKVSVKFVPASTLPVDPTGLSYEAGENTVDPRDQLNPGLVRITNGEDTFENLTGVSIGDQREIYDAMMLDTRWFKWSLQSGCKRSAFPLYWQIGQLHQDYYPGAIRNLPKINTTDSGLLGNTAVDGASLDENYEFHNTRVLGNTDPRGFFQTGHKGKLGWLPTDSLIKYASGPDDAGVFKQIPALAAIPEIEAFKIVLPPAYKTKYYYRAWVTEEVYFSGPIVINYNMDNNNYTHTAIDVFHKPTGTPVSPAQGFAPSSIDAPNVQNDGRNV